MLTIVVIIVVRSVVAGPRGHSTRTLHREGRCVQLRYLHLGMCHGRDSVLWHESVLGCPRRSLLGTAAQVRAPSSGWLHGSRQKGILACLLARSLSHIRSLTYTSLLSAGPKSPTTARPSSRFWRSSRSSSPTQRHQCFWRAWRSCSNSKPRSLSADRRPSKSSCGKSKASYQATSRQRSMLRLVKAISTSIPTHLPSRLLIQGMSSINRSSVRSIDRSLSSSH